MRASYRWFELLAVLGSFLWATEGLARSDESLSADRSYRKVKRAPASILPAVKNPADLAPGWYSNPVVSVPAAARTEQLNADRVQASSPSLRQNQYYPHSYTP